MQDIVLRKVDYLDGSNFIYNNKIPSGMIYLRDIPESNSSLENASITPDHFDDPDLSVEDKEELANHQNTAVENGKAEYTAWNSLKKACRELPLVFSDMYRSPASSEAAYQRKSGVQRPGYSGHNYGVSVDLAVDEIVKRSGKHYPEIVDIMVACGWTPYQGIKTDKNYIRGSEDWHFNFIGDHAHDPQRATSSPPGSAQAESWIKDNFTFDSDPAKLQTMLRDLKFYQGEIDGQIGPGSREAIRKFVAAWIPAKAGHTVHDLEVDELLVRTINIVSCNIIDPSGKKIC